MSRHVKGPLHLIADDLDADVVAIAMGYELEALDVLLTAYARFDEYLGERDQA